MTTTNIPNNLGGDGNETEVYFVDADEVILVEVDAIEIELSRSIMLEKALTIQPVRLAMICPKWARSS